MDNKKIMSALFQTMRLNIINTARAEQENNTIPKSYIYAWSNGVYPMNAGVEYHKPFSTEFDVSEAEMIELAEFYDDLWLNKKPMTFYEIENHFGAREGSTSWDRSKLLGASRYFYLNSMFMGDDFWETVLKPMEHPTEASSITRPFQGHDYGLF
jgi:antitoxin MazE